jgi:hypothetical protein
VWDDVTSEGEDVAAAIERLRQAADPLNADLIQTVEMGPHTHYLMCVWVRQHTANAVLERIRAGMVQLADQIEQGGRRIVPAVLGPDVERIELVGFDVAVPIAEAGASGAQGAQVAAG